VTGRDFVPPEKRRQGLSIRTYRVAEDGTRSRDSGTTTVDPDSVSIYDRHPSARWPACECPQHRS
jgi:hypothetical protein